jgi:hypothetical protein
VNAQLGPKGRIQVDSGGNVVIVAIKTTQTERTLQTFYDGMGVVAAGEALGVSVNLPPRSRITRKERL